MYHHHQPQQQQQQSDQIMTPHESIITQDNNALPPAAVAAPDLAIDYHDISATTLSNPTSFTEFDFNQLHHDVTASNYFTYHADPSTRLGDPMPADIYNRPLPHEYPYQQVASHMNMNMNVMRDHIYGSLPSENSGFMPGIIEGYSVGQFESSRAGAKRQRGGGAAPKGIEKKEKQRRERLGEKYEMLKALIPNRTKVALRLSRLLSYLSCIHACIELEPVN